MREKLNENPVAQIAIIAVLALVVGFFVLQNLSGGEEEGEAAATPPAAETEAVGPTEEAAAAATLEATPASATSSVSAPADQGMPKDVQAAYESGKTLVILIYRRGGIDDAYVSEAAQAVATLEDVDLFEVPVDEIAKYSDITGPLGVNQAPALIVIRSGKLNNGGSAPASVTYGFQTASDVVQAVVDSGYTGPELTYAPN